MFPHHKCDSHLLFHSQNLLMQPVVLADHYLTLIPKSECYPDHGILKPTFLKLLRRASVGKEFGSADRFAREATRKRVQHDVRNILKLYANPKSFIRKF
jgi:hypothetical protein